MFLSLFENLQRHYLRYPLKYLELAFLSLILLILLSLEAQKNILLILFLIIAKGSYSKADTVIAILKK